MEELSVMYYPLHTLRCIKPSWQEYPCPLYRARFQPNWHLAAMPVIEIILRGRTPCEGAPDGTLGTPTVIDLRDWQYIVHLRESGIPDHQRIPCVVSNLGPRAAQKEAARRQIVSLAGAPRQPAHELARAAELHGLRVRDLEAGWGLSSGSLARNSVLRRGKDEDQNEGEQA